MSCCRIVLLSAALASVTVWGVAQDETPAGNESGAWDVNDPPGPRRSINIDTRQGTWTSLDVSPDGSQVVFDLLGDLYVIPIEGGEARSLSSGLAWDMQPRFSPDGQWIAFTSDRAGGDNIWIMRKDGTDARQVSKESFRLLNSPAWSPDGRFIAARKHFTSTRSLGAGEIWLYHVSGGSGLQMTKRPNDQKDIGEPAFSPDGRYVYFSRDSTPGAVFEYSKDVHGQIYVIRRLDRETGDIINFVTGPGGSVRPTPSPDGRLLAFVRRDGLETSIFLRELASGAEWPIYAGLDRDMQETWAIHGVYPAMAWTPDSRSIVFWAGGGIHRIEIDSGEVRPIEFRVRDTRDVTQVVRFPVEVAPDRFDVRMLRWVQVAPTGDKVVFQALGHLYVRDLPEGRPRRLTTQQEHFELYPSFSRDGRQVAYVSWNDEQQGAVRVAPSGGGEGRAVTAARGTYVEPVFSPDGEEIVFRKISTGGLLSPLYSADPGIYRIPAGGGTAALVTRSGTRPQFGLGSDRIFLMRAGEGKRRLVSVDLNGAQEEILIDSENATDFAVSADERWLAFTERFNAFITPLVRTGRVVALGPDSKSVPIRQVSRDAGEYIHWSGDSRRLHWSLGPDLFTRDLTDSFSFVEGSASEIPGPTSEGINIGFQAETDVPSGSLALVGARLITMEGDEVIEQGTVVVSGNRITAVGSADEIEVPANARRVDADGLTIIPGLVDVHHHGGQGQAEIVPQQNWSLFSTLSFGVTTVHDPSSDTSTIFAASEMARAGQIVAPRIYSTGTILYGAEGDFKAEIDSYEDALSHLRRMKAVGAISVKSYNQPRRDQRQQVIAAARELGMMVVPEGGSLFQHNMTMVADGHTGIEHSIPVARIYDDTVQFWAGSQTGYTPTLVVGYGGIWGENYWYQHTRVWENERLTSFVPRRNIEARARRRTMAEDDDRNHFFNARTTKQLIDAGVSVQLGAHGQREGLAPHWELWMFEQGGMTPIEALRCATLNGARYLGLDADIGSLAVGKLADLVVLEANPLDDIRHSERIRFTMINGRLFDARTLNEIGNHPRQRRSFYFENTGPAENN